MFKQFIKQRTPLITAVLVIIFGVSISSQAVNASTVVTTSASKADSSFIMPDSKRTGFLKITNPVNGDLYCIGFNVEINAPVGGDVICAAKSLTINSEITGDVRVAGEVIIFTDNAKVGGNVTSIARSFNSHSKAVFNSELITGAIENNVDGQINGQAKLAGSMINIAGRFEKDVWAETQNLTIDPTLKVTGTLNYSDKEAELSGVTAIGGTNLYDSKDYELNKMHGDRGTGYRTMSAIMTLATVITIGLAIRYFKPSLLTGFIKTNRLKKALPNIGIGLLTAFGGIIASILLLATVILSPVGALLMTLLIASFIVSLPLAMYYLTAHLLKNLGLKHNFRSREIILIAGIIAFLLSIIPTLGSLVLGLAWLLGLGMIVRHFTSKPYRDCTCGNGIECPECAQTKTKSIKMADTHK